MQLKSNSNSVSMTIVVSLSIYLIRFSHSQVKFLGIILLIRSFQHIQSMEISSVNIWTFHSRVDLLSTQTRTRFSHRINKSFDWCTAKHTKLRWTYSIGYIQRLINFIRNIFYLIKTFHEIRRKPLKICQMLRSV